MPNGLAVQILYHNERAQGEVRLGDACCVRPSDELLAALCGEFAGSAVEIVY
jgi:DNA polymerase III subunit alpha